ncbi:MAG: hypothetical protein AAF657_00600 [Acidobacteriota bacterium]
MTNRGTKRLPLAALAVASWVSVGVVTAASPPAMILDLAAVPPEDARVGRVYGASGEGTLGVPVAGGFDCDGDGFRDYAVAYFQADPLQRNNAGEIDLVFGDGSIGGAVDTSVLDPRVLRIAGAGPEETAGNEIWMDDVTGDGLGDLLIGRQNFSPDGLRIGAGALTILVGGPQLRSEAEALRTVDLASPGEAVRATTFVGATALDRLGIWVRSGDVTGDGISDIVLGADQEGVFPDEHRGAVYLIRGGSHLASGEVIDLQFFGTTALAGHIAKITPPPLSTEYHFGATCQIADLDGNGRGEVLASAALNRGGAGLPADQAPPGSAHPVGGSPDGTLYIAWDDNFPAALWPAGYAFRISDAPGSRTILHGAAVHRKFGEEILGGQDYDGDGQIDLFVGDIIGDGSLTMDRPASGVGEVIYQAAALKGVEAGLDNPPAGLRVTRILGPSPGALGGDTAAQGDFDGDGRSDLAFAAPHAEPQDRASAGAVYVLYGQSEGWPALVDTRQGSLPLPSQARITEIQGARGTVGNDIGDTLAYSAAAADLDGDGRTDLIVNEMLGNGLAPQTVDVGNLVVISGAALSGGCLSSSRVLCLTDGRFQVEIEWRDFADVTGFGQVVPLQSNDSGLFWFFSPDNWEVLIKVLDGCQINDRFWVFFAATTDVEFRVRVTDTEDGTIREYTNPLGAAADAVTDVEAFASCS